MYDYILQPELTHHGVKGMKWGVRRDRYHAKSKVAPKRKSQPLRDRIKSSVKKFNLRLPDQDTATTALNNYIRRKSSAVSIEYILRNYGNKGIAAIDDSVIDIGRSTVDRYLANRLLYDLWSN